MKLNLIGISGGKDSSALMLWAIHRSGYPRDSLRMAFADTGNEHEYTYAHVRLLSDYAVAHGCSPIETLKPPLDFYELAAKKKRFPSAKARFCTEELKIKPTLKWVNERIAEGHTVVTHSGVRADESESRSHLEERDLNGILLVEEYRPLLRWKWADVVAIHEEYGVPLNPLYAAGARRVGCFPCVMSRKAEVNIIAKSFPERIEAIRQAEKAFIANGRASTFFHSSTVPARFRRHVVTGKDGVSHIVATIDDVAVWAATGYRCKGSADEPMLFEDGPSCESGYCE